MPLIRRSEALTSHKMPNGATLVVIDSGVAWQSTLRAGLPASAQVLMLSPDRDGVEQITEALHGHESVASLHIVAHGSPGAVRLGSSELGIASLEGYVEHLRAWSDCLKDGDLLIYGCRVAEGGDGSFFLERLRALTGANVAASEHRVGRDGPISNWTLEAQLGPVTTPVAFSEDVRVHYPGHFETVTFSLSSDTMVEDEGTPISFNFDIEGEIPPGGTVIRLQAETPGGQLITNAISQWDVFQLGFNGVTFEDVSPGLDFTIFELTITEPNASITTVTFNDFVDDSPQTFVWKVTPISAGTTVVEENNVVTIYDTRSEVPIGNADPDAVDDSATTAFETPAEIDVLGNDSDPDEDPLEITEVTQGQNGSVVIDDKGTADTSDDTVIYTPDEGFEGEDSFTYTVSDGEGGTDTATVNVTVEERPPLPVVGFTVDTTTLIEDEGTAVTLTFNVENLPPEGVTVALGAYRPGDSGMDLLERALGDYDFFPPPPNLEFSGLIGTPFGFNGNSGVAFTIGQDGATITLPINDDNDIPPDQPGGNVNTDFGIEQQVWRLIDFSLANPPFNEVDEYVVADGQGEVTLTLRDTANFTPEAVDDSATTAFETPADIDVLSNDTDLDEDPLEITEVTQGANGSVVIDDKGTADTSDDTVIYTPDEGFEGEDSFTYTVSDGRGESATATVAVTVEEQPNQDPDAVDDSATTGFETTVEISVLGNDSDPDEDPLEITEVTQGANGSVVIDDKGTADTSDDTVVYTPDEGFEGEDSFTYTVSDGQGGTDTATVNVTVEEQPTPPTVTFSLSSDTMVEDENTPISFNFDVTGDIPSEGVKVRLQAETPGGELITNAISQWDVFQLGFNGVSFEDVSPGLDFTIFELTITQPNASITTVTFNDFVDDSPQTFVWKVTPVTDGTTVIEENNVVTIYDTRSEIPGENSPPDAVDDAVSGTEDAPIEGNVLADNSNGPDSDPDVDDVLTVSRVNGQQANVGTQITLASGALLVLNADGTFAYDANEQFEFLAEGESETDSFTYEISDGNGGTDTATVTVTIDGVNDDPTAADDGGAGFTTDEDNGFTTGNVLDNDSDVDASDSLSVESIDASGTLGLVTDNGDGTFDYDPNGQFEDLADGETATDSFTYTVSDGNGGTSTATVTITINGADEERNVIEGEDGNDNLVGTADDDLLIGNGGAFDFFSGGGGSDIFRFNATDGNGREVGTITDYTPGEDFIDLGDSTVNFSFDAGEATYLFLEGGDFDTLIVNGASSINEISFV